ncbi:MAG: prephenate dehydratase, partial [Armatimonadota bacterium]
LMRAMAALDAHDVNLTMIESRPTKQMPWEYVFFLDFQGHVKEERVSRALRHLSEQSLFVTVLGSYPEAD